MRINCLTSLFYIKPQHVSGTHARSTIVLHLYSTSNHNRLLFVDTAPVIVLHLYSTSNHNWWTGWCFCFRLSYISILHQTTTVIHICPHLIDCLTSLFYIKPQLVAVLRRLGAYCLTSLFYIKPQLPCRPLAPPWDCLTSLFYIKPQPLAKMEERWLIVLHLYSTSNHNLLVSLVATAPLSYISILHQTTTWWTWLFCFWYCLTSLFYIKPQRALGGIFTWRYCLTSLFYIKPQLWGWLLPAFLNCLTSLFYIKPQRRSHTFRCRHDCLTSLFYIKPQQKTVTQLEICIVLHLYSTSNHNSVLYLVKRMLLSYISILHQTTTCWLGLA